MSDLDSLKPLGKSTADTLERVDLSANPVTDVNGYRDFMFEMLPMLQVLDGLDRSGVEDYADVVHDLDEIPGAQSKLAKPEDALKPHWMQERELEDRLLINNPRNNDEDEEDFDDEDDDDEDEDEDYAQDDEVEVYEEEEDDFLPKKPGQAGQDEEDDDDDEDDDDEDDSNM